MPFLDNVALSLISGIELGKKKKYIQTATDIKMFVKLLNFVSVAVELPFKFKKPLKLQLRIREHCQSLTFCQVV